MLQVISVILSIYAPSVTILTILTWAPCGGNGVTVTGTWWACGWPSNGIWVACIVATGKTTPPGYTVPTIGVAMAYCCCWGTCWCWGPRCGAPRAAGVCACAVRGRTCPACRLPAPSAVITNCTVCPCVGVSPAGSRSSLVNSKKKHSPQFSYATRPSRPSEFSSDVTTPEDTDIDK